MKRRIEQLLNGIFEYEPPRMQISTERIELKVRRGDRYRGSFELESTTRKKIKGFLYSSGTRMAYGPSGFSGLQEKITYEFDSAGLEEGDVTEGVFTICSNVGEYRIPYKVTVYGSSSKEAGMGLLSLDELGRMAKEDFQKAYLAFLSPGFSKMLREKAGKFLPLYEGLTGTSPSYRSLEEFLIATGQKEPVKIVLERASQELYGISQSVKESVTLTKNTWGFLKLDITADAPFLKIERPVVTADEFIGSTYSLDYLIDAGKLHAGRNYGRIMLKSPFRTWKFEITVYREGKKQGTGTLLAQHRQVGQMLSLYVDFRLKRRNIHQWIQKSQESLDAYRKAGGKDTMLELFQAQLYFAEDRADEACLLLNGLDEHKEKLNTPEILGYYLYLTTFYNQDPKYVDYAEERVATLFLQNQDNWKLQWFLLYLRDTYRKHPAEKLEAIKRQYLYGCSSRIMYLEAYYVLEKFPMLLKKLDSFELRVLRFICREGLMSRDLSMQISDLAGRYREYSESLSEILACCYRQFPTKALLQSVCSLLIKAHKTGKDYFSWYEKAVEADLRITGLYEYYVESMDGTCTGPLPRMIRMYFSYNNTLSYQKKASIYANVIRNRKEDPKTYQSYRPAMEKFMLDQLLAGRVNEDLALIYRTFLNRSMLNRRLADCLVKILFTYEVCCSAPIARQVVVSHLALKQEQCVALTEGKAFVQIYSEDHQLFFLDEEENRYAHLTDCQVKKVLDEPEFLQYCRELSPASPGLVLHTCAGAGGSRPVNEKNMESFWNLLAIEEVRESSKEEVRQLLLDYYYENQSEPTLYEFLHRIDYSVFIRTDKQKLVELLAGEGMCREAFELLRVYGTEQVGSICLVRICSRTVLDREYAQDDMLTALCHCCFEQGKYDETVLRYLVRWYDGPVEEMKKLWRISRKFELEAYELEEKILLMLLFMRTGAADTEEIFDSYRRSMGKQKLIEAYLIYRSYDYFVKEVPVQEPVFTQLACRLEKGEELEEICRLALLRWYSERAGEQSGLDEKQQFRAGKLLEEFCHRGMYFAFYGKFGQDFGRAFGIEDKCFAEYRTNPEATVILQYRIEQGDGEVTAEGAEPLRNVYEGIFVKEVTLFQGELYSYRITEELDGRILENPEEVLIWEGTSQGKRSRYDLINRLETSLDQGDLEEARADILLYREQEALAKELFPLV